LLKNLHLVFVTLVIISFLSRVMLAEFKPAQLQQKWLKITPHVLDTFLLLSGLALVIQGNWLARDFSWIVAKISILLVYIGMGMIAMRKPGLNRWLASILSLIHISEPTRPY